MKKPRGTRVQFCGNIFFFCFTDLFPILVLSLDTISPAQPLADNQTLVSAGGAFELGLFTPGNSKWYLGIWYKKNIPTKTYVWVANRDAPLESSSAILKIGDHGNLVLLNHSHSIIWSSNQTDAANPVAQLLDSGNFVVRKADSFDFLWQSFDYPANTLLPGMKLGWNRERGSNQYLRSWKSPSDPSPGDYAFKIDPNGFPEFFLWRKRERRYRSGPWNGLRFSGVPEMETGYIVNFSFVENRVGVYYSFEVESNSLISRLSVNSSGVLQRFMWIESDRVWNLFWYAPKDQCDNYRECGPYGICDPNASPVCKCPRGFRPRNPRAWYLRDGSGGCVRKTDSDSDCRAVGFLRMKNMKLPESSTASVDRAMSLKECEERCRGNCSCTAYASADISDGARGCVIWSVELMDMRQYAELEGGQDLYVRLAASELDGGSSVSRTDSNGKREKILKIVGIAAGILTGALLFGLCNYYFWKRKTMRGIWKACPGQKGPSERSQDLLLSEAVIPSKSEFLAKSNPDELELPLFDLNIIITATDNFSNANKLGQGGFGCVYKGMFLDGQEVAVKRLSQGSGQGMEEFKNEVRLIARLQHRNLVRLLGCCIDMDEKMLIYEYMRHRSLDSVLFRKEKNSPLDWKKRFEIICGTARGLLYLHQDSRFRIIHRDLKASNILLDEEMNPKISDFGMARIFGRDQNEANTKKVVGTYGYMSPEYAMDGLFSVKSDVFSFGVLVLEIVSGKKNRGFYSTDDELNLLGHAWKLWNEQKALQLLDPRAGDSYSGHEALRCVQTGLLCVQERAEDRPTMATVMLMLNSETATMPQPKHPGFCLGRSLPETDSSSSKQDQSFTVNQVTVTALDAR